MRAPFLAVNAFEVDLASNVPFSMVVYCTLTKLSLGHFHLFSFIYKKGTLLFINDSAIF